MGALLAIANEAVQRFLADIAQRYATTPGAPGEAEMAALKQLGDRDACEPVSLR